MSDKTIEMPGIEDEQLLNDVMEDSVDEVGIKDTKKKYKIGWMKKGTMRKISSVALEKGNDDTLSAKTAALIILNNYWKIKFFYPILWRWFFYVKEYTDEQLSEILAVGKKKSSLHTLPDKYHISDRHEGHDNDDDEGGSRAYPSRTAYGEASAIGEKHGWLMQPLILLGGAIKIPMYGYYWIHTSAQVDLMAIDVPVVNYKRSKDGEVKHTKREMSDVMAKWEAKRRAQGKSTDFKTGEKVNLNDFLRTGMDAFKNTKTE